MPSRRIPFSVHIAYLFVGLLLAFAAISNSFQFFETRHLVTEAAAERYALIGKRSISVLHSTYNRAALIATLLAKQDLIEATSLQQRLDGLEWMTAALREQPNISALYLGYATGDFFMLRRWRDDPQLQTLFDAPHGSAWMVQSIQVKNGKPIGEHLFFSNDLALLERRAKPDYQYDPRTRCW